MILIVDTTETAFLNTRFCFQHMITFVTELRLRIYK
jgi:hypothetical protein